jgi:hypothetical protein
MPPKGKGSPKKDPEAERAEEEARKAAEEAEKKKTQEEEERKKRDEEDRLRKDEEEAKRQAADAQRRRDDEERRAKEDEERRHREREREIQQLQLLEEKDKEINDLNEKVFALNRSFGGVQTELEQESRRAASLTNELEVTQMKLVEYEHEMERRDNAAKLVQRKSDEDASQLRMQLEVSHQNTEKYMVECEGLRSRLRDETESLRTEIAQLRTDKEKDDTENTILMKLLHTELDKYKQQTQHLQGDLERKEREDVKNTIMLGLLNSQLDSNREENKRLSEMLNDYRKRVEVLEKKLDAATQNISSFETSTERTARETTLMKDQLIREIDMHKAKVELLTASQARLNEELDTTKSQFLNYQSDAERRDKESFEKNVILKSELEHLRRQFHDLTAAKKDLEDKSFEQNAKQKSEIESLKLRNTKLTETIEKNDKTAFEALTVDKAEIDTLKAKLEHMTQDAREAEKSNFSKLTELRGDLEVEKTSNAQLKILSERKEREYFEQLTKLTAELDLQHRQLIQLQTLHEKKDKEYVETTIFGNSEKENLKNKIAMLEEKAERTSREHNEYAVKMQQQISVLNKQIEENSIQHTASIRVEGEKQIQIEQELKAAQGRVRQLEEDHARKDKDNWDRSNAYKAEVASLRNEVDGYKQMVEKLEGSIAENYNFKILAEQNEMLKADLQSYKNQISNLNNTIATMKVEADILDNYKTKVLQEQNEAYLRRIQDLEKESKMVTPLMNELIATLQRHGLTTSLQADIDTYRSQFRKGSVGGNSGVPPPKQLQTAASMGRHEIAPINQYH